jgi:hypothetical protein
MKAIDRKLLRDLWSLKTQVVSIALVIACGIGAFIASFSTHESLSWSRERYYDTARFAHVFATLKRAPAFLDAKIRAIPDVSEVETRVVRDAQLSVPDVVPPMIARLIGIDFARPGGMNRLTLKSGRWPAPGTRTEVVVNHRFMEARKLPLGVEVDLLLNGKREHLSIVGTVLTPEYIYATRGGGMPDDEWFAVRWMDAEPRRSTWKARSTRCCCGWRGGHRPTRWWRRWIACSTPTAPSAASGARTRCRIRSSARKSISSASSAPCCPPSSCWSRRSSSTWSCTARSAPSAARSRR